MTNTGVIKKSDRELTISRLLDAPRELVWEMWTNPEHIKHWWGPNGFTNTIYKMDVKKGGEWDFIMHGPDGKDFRNKHIFVELVKPEKIVLLHATAPKFQMEATFTTQGNKTLMTLNSKFESAEQLQEVIKLVKADEGLKQNVDKLEEYITKVPAQKELVILRQFNAPRKLVFKAFADAEALKQWWGPKGAEIEISKLDFKPGGIFHYSMKSPMGEMWGKFNYLEINEPEKIVFTNSFSDKDANTVRAPFSNDFPMEIMNSITLTEHEGKTTLLIKGGPLNPTDAEQNFFTNMFSSMQQGFGGTFDQLDEYLANSIK
jgi:uncharacterized protein YndB with AHSA1/START domain